MSKPSWYHDPSDNSLNIVDLDAFAAEQDLRELVDFYGADPDDPNSIMEARRRRHERQLGASRDCYVKELEAGIRASRGLVKTSEEIVEIHTNAVKKSRKRQRASKRQRSEAGKKATLRGDTLCLFWLAITNRIRAFGFDDTESPEGDFLYDLYIALQNANHKEAMSLATGFFNDDDKFVDWLLEKVIIGTPEWEDSWGTEGVDFFAPTWFHEAENRDGKIWVSFEYRKARGGEKEVGRKEFSPRKVNSAVAQIRKFINENS